MVHRKAVDEVMDLITVGMKAVMAAAMLTKMDLGSGARGFSDMALGKLFTYT
jgi:hypothetical protein